MVLESTINALLAGDLNNLTALPSSPVTAVDQTHPRAPNPTLSQLMAQRPRPLGGPSRPVPAANPAPPQYLMEQDLEAREPEAAEEVIHTRKWKCSFCEGQGHKAGMNVCPKIEEYRAQKAFKTPAKAKPAQAFTTTRTGRKVASVAYPGESPSQLPSLKHHRDDEAYEPDDDMGGKDGRQTKKVRSNAAKPSGRDITPVQTVPPTGSRRTTAAPKPISMNAASAGLAASNAKQIEATRTADGTANKQFNQQAT